MYIKRTPLGQGGGLSFRKQRPRYPTILVFGYFVILLAAIGALAAAPVLQPVVTAVVLPDTSARPVSWKLLKLAEKSYTLGDLKKAAEFYRQAAELQPDDLDVLTPYARILTLNKDNDVQSLSQAVAVADHMIEVAPEDARGYAARARALDWQGNYQDAVLMALKAIELDNNYAPGHAYLAEAYADLGRLRQAREQAELAIQLGPYDVDARRNYGYILEFYGDYEGAIQQYLQALSLEPNSLDLMYGLARNYRGARRYEEAIATFNEIARRTSTDPAIYIELGKTYFEIREDDAAQENLEHAVELVCKECPLYTSSDILNGGVLDRPRDLPAQISYSAWTRLGQVYATRRNYESSIAILEEAIACSEQGACGVKKDSAPVEVYYVTAAAYYYLDECKLAVGHARTALNLYNQRKLDDPNAIKNILSVFILCRDYADHPFAYQGAGFTNGYPDGYAVVDVIVRKPGSSGGASPQPTPQP
jgi:tetratricopeptide (TPR) repeat protein